MLHLLGNAHYGFFRDELYFIVCGRHPQFGYVDQPPLVPLLAAGSQRLGASLLALRIVPGILAAAATAATCLLTRAMGGSGFAILLASIGVALAPVLSAFGTILGPDSVQAALWPMAILFMARALHGQPRYWLAAGTTFGIAGEAKYSAIMAAAALLAGLLVTGRLRAFASPWLWAGIIAAGLILLPNALWQMSDGLPMLELLRNGQHGKNVVLGAVQFLLQQIQLTNPVLAVVWIIGLAWCLITPAWRWLGAGACILLAMMIALHGKAYYPAPLYPALFAAGGVAAAKLAQGRPRLHVAAAGTALAAGLALLPMTLPILPEAQMAAYLDALSHAGLRLSAGEHHRPAALGQIYADMHGWQELADEVTDIASHLPAGERRRLAIFTANYGEAAAIDVLAPPGALPPAMSGHNQYFLWGPGNWDGSALLDIGGKLDDDKTFCSSAVMAGTFNAPWAMPYEDGLAIILCRDLKLPVDALWPSLKHYD